jgi:hypothetical protein
MIIGRIALFVGLLFGTAATQLPEFEQQYRQRLGGAIDELTAIVQKFDSDSAEQGLSEAAGIARLQENPDIFIRGRGNQMQDIVSRLQRLQRTAESFENSGQFGRLVLLAENFDLRVARRAYEGFEPAVPVTAEGFVTGLIGFLVGGGLTRFLLSPFGRRRARQPKGKAVKAKQYLEQDQTKGGISPR